MGLSAIKPDMIRGQRTIDGLRVTHFSQVAKSGTPRHYHENATFCVLLRGTARDLFRNRTIEFEPGTAIYRPPAEEHSHQFGTNGMVAIVIEVPASRLRADSSLNFLSELRVKSNALTLADSAQLLACLGDPESTEAELEEHCLSLPSVFNRDGEDASSSDGVGRVRMLLDQCITERHSLAELGSIADLHPAYLVRAFRKRFGCSIGQYRSVVALRLPSSRFGTHTRRCQRFLSTQASTTRVTAPMISVDRHRVGVWGISQAGWVIPHAAARAPDAFAFGIIVTRGGLKPIEIEEYDYATALDRAAVAADDRRTALALVGKHFTYLKTGNNRLGLEKDIQSACEKSWFKAVDVSRVLPAEAVRGKWEWVANYDPALDIQKITMLVLVLLGGKDRPGLSVKWNEAWRRNLDIWPTTPIAR